MQDGTGAEKQRNLHKTLRICPFIYLKFPSIIKSSITETKKHPEWEIQRGNHMKKRIHLLGALLIMSLLTGCGSSSVKYMESAGTETYDTAASEEIFYEDDAEMLEVAEASVVSDTEISETVQTGRKLIRNFDINIQTREFDEVISNIQKKVQELGGYIENSSLDSGSSYYRNYNRYNYMTVRIPSDQLDSFIDNVKETANVTYISESTEDITLQYVDVESRKTALETERDRLLELLEKAETVEDLITIESRLSEVRYQLESYTSQLRTYDNQVDYSTVTISVNEVERETKTEPKTFWEEVSQKFGNNLYELGKDFRNAAIWFLSSLPYLLIWAVGITAVILLIRKIKSKGKTKGLFRKITRGKSDQDPS